MNPSAERCGSSPSMPAGTASGRISVSSDIMPGPVLGRRYQVPVAQPPVGVLIEYVVCVMSVGAELTGGGPQKR